jgi:hypothetical protein
MATHRGYEFVIDIHRDIADQDFAAGVEKLRSSQGRLAQAGDSVAADDIRRTVDALVERHERRVSQR